LSEEDERHGIDGGDPLGPSRGLLKAVGFGLIFWIVLGLIVYFVIQ